MSVVGSATPRVGTEPLRELTPATSLGFDLCDFAAEAGVVLLPWQREAAIRALELLPDGSYRFRTVLILVGRQCGKTTLLKVWALWRLLRDDARLVLGAAQKLDMAQEAWQGSVDLIQESPWFGSVDKVRYANGENCLTLNGGARYRIVSTTRGGGRGLSVDLLILDEMREQRTWEAWSALSKTLMARPRGQAVCISNAGDDESVVLNSFRDAALAGRDDTLCLLEWSAPEGCDMDDREAWAMALPALGHGLLTEAAVASALATDPPAVFRTEMLCQHVTTMNAAISHTGWQAGADPNGSVAAHKDRLYAGLDVSEDGNHVALVVAALVGDDVVRVEPVASWASTLDARRELPALLEVLRPVGLAWYPTGPANALAAVLRPLRGNVELTGTQVPGACMGFADLVAGGQVLHNADALLDGQVGTAGKAPQGDGFRFTRRGNGNCDALYAAAAAVHLARNAKPPRARVFVA